MLFVTSSILISFSFSCVFLSLFFALCIFFFLRPKHIQVLFSFILFFSYFFVICKELKKNGSNFHLQYFLFLLLLRLCFSFYLFVVKLNNNKEQRVESTNKSLASFYHRRFFPLDFLCQFLILSSFLSFLEVFFFSCSEILFFFLCTFFFGVAAINCFSKAFLFLCLLSAMLMYGGV